MVVYLIFKNGVAIFSFFSLGDPFLRLLLRNFYDKNLCMFLLLSIYS